MGRRKMGLIAGCTLLIGTAVGCDSPAARTQLARRERSANFVRQHFAESEARCANNLTRLGELARKQHERDILYTKHNAAKLERAFPEECLNWQRKAPAYREAINRELAGNVANLEPTLIKILY